MSDERDVSTGSLEAALHEGHHGQHEATTQQVHQAVKNRLLQVQLRELVMVILKRGRVMMVVVRRRLMMVVEMKK